MLVFLLLLPGIPIHASEEREFRLRDINVGGGSSPEGGVALRNGLFVFAADDGIHGTELWATDGTTNGTMLLKDIRTGMGGSFPHNFSAPITFETFTAGGFVTRTLVFFAADEGMTGTELWATDGTTNTGGTFLVHDIRTVPGEPNHDPLGSSFPYSLTVLNGKLIFGANDGAAGVELWCHNPTNNSTFMLKDIWPGDAFSHSLPNWLTVVGSNLFFSATDHRTVQNGGTGTELWKTDGTSEGTVLVADLYPGPGSGLPHSSGPRWLANLNGALMFVAWNGTGFDNQLWRYDNGGLTLVKVFGEISSPPEQLHVVGSNLFLAATDHLLSGGPFPAHGQELWRSDGTGAGTVMVKDINPTMESGIAFGSQPRQFVDVNGRLFFTAFDNATDRELWTSDGTSGGTFRVEDIRPGATGSNPEYLTACGRLLYFVANNGVDGVELWRVPPGTTTAVMATNLNPGAAGSFPIPLGYGGRHLIFAADDGISGNELWAVEYNTYLVTSTADSGSGSLRQAILDANAFTNPPGCIDRICIDIPGPGPHALNLQSQLPTVTDPVTICDPLYDPTIEARFLTDGNLLGLNASGLIVLTKDTEVIGIGFTRFKTGLKLDQGGANINLQGLLFLQISDIGIEANLATSGLYQFHENRFRGGMNFGTRIIISGNVEVEVNYQRNLHTNNQVAIEATEQLSGSAKWIVADNTVTNGGTGGRFFIKVAGTKDFARNRWEGHISAGLTYICSVSQGVTIIVKSEGDVAAGNGFEGVRGEVSGGGEVRFLLLRLGSSDNSKDGVGLFAQAGAKLILEGHEWEVQRNGGFGLYLQGASAALKAGYHLQDSVIKDNDLDGQWLVDVEFPFSMLNNTFTGNGGSGVVLAGSSIGRISGNTIQGNTGAGVLIQDTASATISGNTITGNGLGIGLTGTGTGTSIADNTVAANTGMAIDLGNDGPTPNDPGDSDTGPNNLQNHPMLTSAINSGGSAVISGSLDSLPASTFTLRFFAGTCHPSGRGEGGTFLGSTNVSTDASGQANFTFISGNALASGSVIGATATDAGGSTSEFSSCRVVGEPSGLTLMISRSSADLFRISWPDSGPELDLEFTTNLGNPSVWWPVTHPVLQTNGEFLITIRATNLHEFYRLRQP